MTHKLSTTPLGNTYLPGNTCNNGQIESSGGSTNVIELGLVHTLGQNIEMTPFIFNPTIGR